MMEIRVERMTPEDIVCHKKYAIQEWARYSVMGGARTEEAAHIWASQLINKLIPNPNNSEPQHLFNILLGEQKIGIFWVEIKGELAYGRDFEINEEFRGKGYGKAAISAMEKLKREFPQVKKIKLEVHAHNTVAKNLYEQIGFKPYQIVMTKDL